ncbi:MAG: hypothetical protein NVS3B8_12920 [Chitinophagaceae bacterium]
MVLATATKQKAKKAGKYVNGKHVDSLLNNYKKERWVQNSRHIGKEDSLSVWYSVEELQGFLETAKQNGADGIKMYFGVYKADTAKEERYEERQTIVMIASKTKVLDNGISADKNVYINSDKGPEILAYNTGRICPPTCGSGEVTDPGTGFDWDNMGILIDRKDEGMIVI